MQRADFYAKWRIDNDSIFFLFAERFLFAGELKIAVPFEPEIVSVASGASSVPSGIRSTASELSEYRMQPERSACVSA